MYALVLVVHLLVSFVLIAVILLQAGRGGGLADFAGAGSSALGTRASTYLTKATTVCAVVFLCTSITLAVLSARQGRSLMQQARAAKPAAATAKTPAAAPATATTTPPAVASTPAPAAATATPATPSETTPAPAASETKTTSP